MANNLQGSDQKRPRARDLGLTPGQLQPGPHNAITDVLGVRVGHCTINSGEGVLVPGEGPVRTGVTAVIPQPGNMFSKKVPAAVHVINGFGKAAGLTQLAECGVLETPIVLTNTLNVGLASDALIEYMLRDNPDIGVSTSTVNPVVLECNDGYLNDIRGRHVKHDHVFSALREAASGPVAEGAVGAGTGMMAFEWKGGIGTSSRQIPIPGPEAGRNTYVLGALVLSNFGSARDLIVDGWPVGRFLQPPINQRVNTEGDGSVIVILATDAPLETRQLRRIATRSVVGLVRCGARLSHGSGDYAIAFSTAERIAHTMNRTATRYAPELWPDDSLVMADLLRAAGEATEEAVLNSLLQAHTVVGRDNHVRHALPYDVLEQLLRQFADIKITDIET